MPFTTSGNNAMLGGLTITHASIHSAFPGTTGANEISGGSPAYARRPVTFAAAANSTRLQTGDATFDIPPATAMQYLGYWTAITGGTFLGYHPFGNAAALAFVSNLATETLTSPAHGLSNGDQIVFVGGTPPLPLVEGTVYFVVGSTVDTLQVSASSGGSVINLTAHATNACQLIKIVPEFFGSQGTVRTENNTLSQSR